METVSTRIHFPGVIAEVSAASLPACSVFEISEAVDRASPCTSVSACGAAALFSLSVFTVSDVCTALSLLLASAESEVFAEESRNIFGIYLQKYCQAMTNTKAEPPRALALYYARILPHVLHIMYGIETIPDSKGASAAWAFEHMQEKTMEILGEQSEEEMQELMYDSLQWSEHFWKQMQLEIYINSERMFLKDVVYTEVYDQRRIDDWSESMHKTVTELAHREIKKDKRLANWAVDHIVESDKTYNLFKGGRKK